MSDAGNDRRRSSRTAATAQSTGSSTPAGLVAGAVLAGVGIIGALAARWFFGKKPTAEPKKRPTIVTKRRTVPPRRPRSNASGASSARTR